MPKATLVFSLPDEREEHEMAVKAPSYMRIIRDLSDEMRTIIKHGDQTAEYKAGVEHVRELLFDLANEEGVEIL